MATTGFLLFKGDRGAGPYVEQSEPKGVRGVRGGNDRGGVVGKGGLGAGLGQR